jgi:hypothetical protein
MILKCSARAYPFPTDGSRARLTFDKAMIGSCTNGSYRTTCWQRRRGPRGARTGSVEGVKEFVCFRIWRRRLQIERPDPRLDGESIAACSARSEVRSANRGAGLLRPGPARSRSTAITSFNRNWQIAWASAVSYLASRLSSQRRHSLATAPPSGLISSGTRLRWRVKQKAKG